MGSGRGAGMMGKGRLWEIEESLMCFKGRLQGKGMLCVQSKNGGGGIRSEQDERGSRPLC